MPVGSLDRFDFHDLGTESTEVAREVGARPERGQVKDFQVRDLRAAATQNGDQSWNRVPPNFGTSLTRSSACPPAAPASRPSRRTR